MRLLPHTGGQLSVRPARRQPDHLPLGVYARERGHEPRHGRAIRWPDDRELQRPTLATEPRRRLGHIPGMLVAVDGRYIQPPEWPIRGERAGWQLRPRVREEARGDAVRDDGVPPQHPDACLPNDLPGVVGEEDHAGCASQGGTLRPAQHLEFEAHPRVAVTGALSGIERQQVTRHGYHRPKAANVAAAGDEQEIGIAAGESAEAPVLPVQA